MTIDPPTLTQIEQICTILRMSVDYETAATACGIRPAVSSFWRDEVEKKNPDYEEFAWQVQQAHAMAEVLLTQKIISGTDNSAKWLLERKYPGKYGKPGKKAVRMQIKDDKKEIDTDNLNKLPISGIINIK